MKLTLLGTGTPWPSVRRQATANLLRAGSDTILIDAGRGASTQLAHVGVHPREIDVILITHHHFDHLACLDDLLLAAWNNGRRRPVRVFGPDGTQDIVAHLFDDIYARDIAFRMKEAQVLGHDLPHIRDIVQVRDIAPMTIIKGNGWAAHSQHVEHGHALGLGHDEWPCYGYRVTAGDRTLTISGDTIDCAGVRSLARDADLLVQCCYMAEAEIDSHERRVVADMVLASAVQANQIARAAGVKRMVLTHLAPKSAAMLGQVLQEAGQGLEIEVILGVDLMELIV